MFGAITALIILSNLVFMSLLLASAGVWAPVVIVGCIFTLIVTCAAIGAGQVEEYRHAMG